MNLAHVQIKKHSPAACSLANLKRKGFRVWDVKGLGFRVQPGAKRGRHVGLAIFLLRCKELQLGPTVKRGKHM